MEPFESIDQLADFLASEDMAEYDRAGLIHLYPGGRDWLLCHIAVALEGLRAQAGGVADDR